MKIFENINIIIKQLSSKTECAIAQILFKNSITISTAESCTGGLISSRLTDIAGSSSYIKENFVTYSNEAKISLLDVMPETISKYGAVSEECAAEMAQGLFNRLNCDISVATTGVAGPSGSENKPVGLLYIAIKNKDSTKVQKIELNPNYSRKTLKYMFSQKALEFLLEFLKENYTIKETM